MNNLHALLALIERLQGPQGCAWDQKQTLKSMQPRLLEESYEVFEAIEQENPLDLCEELGDLLFVMLSCVGIANAQYGISLEDICDKINKKMIRRHPHLFQGTTAPQSWEAQKNRDSLLDGIPTHLPALLIAQKQAQRASTVGFDWPDVAGVLQKIEEELTELKEALHSSDLNSIEHEIGDLLMATSNLSRKHNLSAELALKKATNRFDRRFRFVEKHAPQKLENCSLEELENLWQRAKMSGN